MATPSGHGHPAHLVEDVPKGKFNPPTQFHPNPPMYFNFGQLFASAQPAHLVEDVPEASLTLLPNFIPIHLSNVILGSFLPRPQATPTPPT